MTTAICSCGDRKSHMIISGGVNIYPAEIESIVLEHPAVKDCAVFGIPDERFGEAVALIVERLPGQVVSEEEIEAFVPAPRCRVQGAEADSVPCRAPRDDSGKIFKRALRAPFWERLAAVSEQRVEASSDAPSPSHEEHTMSDQAVVQLSFTPSACRAGPHQPSRRPQRAEQGRARADQPLLHRAVGRSRDPGHRAGWRRKVFRRGRRHPRDEFPVHHRAAIQADRTTQADGLPQARHRSGQRLCPRRRLRVRDAVRHRDLQRQGHLWSARGQAGPSSRCRRHAAPATRGRQSTTRCTCC